MKQKNLATSVRQRLQKIAKEEKRDYNAVLLNYVQERFLFRLSKSPYKNTFILKGALLFTAFHLSLLRPTKDIDFLGNSIQNDEKILRGILQEICQIDFQDGIVFVHNSIETSRISELNKYHGIRAKLVAHLGTARIKLSLDFGFGDKIIGKAKEIEYPVLLDFEPPKIKVYPLESAIAEKLQACVKLNYHTSRLKDIFDIHEFASNHTFNLSKLKRAIEKTFQTRGTALEDIKIIFSNEFKNNYEKEIQWRAFLKRHSLASPYSFKEIMERIETFVDVNAQNKHRWDNKNWKWV